MILADSDQDKTGRLLTSPCWIGAKRALPIVLGYVPIGFAYGVLAGKSGLSETNTLLMSLIVFAGSAQFIAVGLFASGTGPAAVILTTFVVNLRHMLMAASLAPYLSAWKKRYLAFFSYQLTDETFALHSSTAGKLNECRVEALSLNMTAQVFLGAWDSTRNSCLRPDT